MQQKGHFFFALMVSTNVRGFDVPVHEMFVVRLENP